MRDKTAAIIVIGNEILSGKVADTNSTFLAQELRRLGVTLSRILVIPDDLQAIAEAVRTYRPAVDVIFTSGGVGPTHDDVTMEGVARGLDRGVIRHPFLEQKIRELSGNTIDDARLKMAEVPRNGNPTRIRNRCELTGRSRAYYRKFRLSRIMLRELANKGLIPGVIKSSW